MADGVVHSSKLKEKRYHLHPETELRFVVENKSKVVLELESGLAEIFGTELLTEKKYVFDSNTRVTVFTWHGCTLLLKGYTQSADVIKETPMIIYANVHAAIEQMRQLSNDKYSKGPAVLVAGPTDVGKSTMCRFLLNYAVRQGRTPVFIDLDVGQGQISVPGTVGALLVEKTADIEGGFTQHKPLVYHFGHKSPGHNFALYTTLVSELANNVKTRARQNSAISVSGVIINTCGWVKSDGYRAITQAVLAFEVDVVLVLGKENLYYQIARDVPQFVKVVYIPKFEGVVERSRSDRFEERDNRVCQYFYGYNRNLVPHSFKMDFADVKIYKIVPQQMADNTPEILLLDNGLCLTPVEADFHLLNHILSVTFSSELTKDIITTNVTGFICVTQVDINAKKLTILSPQPPPLPNAILLFSDVTFSRDL